MRISNCLLAVCVTISSLTVRASDENKAQGDPSSQPLQPAVTPTATLAQAQTAPAATPAQPDQPVVAPTHRSDKASIDKARDALHQKMQQLSQPQTEAAQPAAAPVPAPAPTSAPATAPGPAPAAAAPPPATTPPPAAAAAAVPAAAPTPTPVAVESPAPVIIPPSAAPAAQSIGGVPVPVSDEAIAKARAAVREKTQELEAQTPASVPPPATAPAAVAATAAAASAPAPVTQTEPVVPGSADPEAIAKAREAMRKKMDETESTPQSEVASSQSQKSAFAPNPSRQPTGKNVGGFPALKGPPTGLSADKEQRLQTLLAKYKGDEITPEEYQAERAKIIGGP